MHWLSTFFASSIGKKLIMSLTGLFLILFLVVHLLGNLQLLKGDGGEAFNIYADFMVHNPLIKTVSYGLYFFILLHSFQGLYLWFANQKAKGGKYAVKANPERSYAARSMVLLGTIILVFLVIHMGDFWYKMKFTDSLPQVTYPGHDTPVKDLFAQVNVTFKQGWFVAFYVISMVVLALHLLHGFQSAFQTLGINHRKYTPIIKGVGVVYSLVISFGYAIIPIYYFFFK
jgi:succinate dehydrogenase / fumarate reductase, cytochrome b subunit